MIPWKVNYYRASERIHSAVKITAILLTPKNEENPRIAEEKILKRINKLKVL